MSTPTPIALNVRTPLLAERANQPLLLLCAIWAMVAFPACVWIARATSPSLLTHSLFLSIPLSWLGAGLLIFTLRSAQRSHEERFGREITLAFGQIEDTDDAPPEITYLRPDPAPGWWERRLHWTPRDPLPEVAPSFEEAALEHQTNPQAAKRFWIFLAIAAIVLVAITAARGLPTWGQLLQNAVSILIVTLLLEAATGSWRKVGRLTPIVDPVGIELRSVTTQRERLDWARTRVVIVGDSRHSSRVVLVSTADDSQRTLDIPKAALPALLASVRAGHTLAES